MDEAVERNLLPATMLTDSLKELGLKVIEAIDYLDEFDQHVHISCEGWGTNYYDPVSGDKEY